MNDPKLTVIIPTRERCDVLIKSLQTVTAQDYHNLQIIVSDNFSSDDTEEVVRSFADTRVSYLNTGRRLSMSHNWEFALSHVADGWVTIIGDDDGLLPNSMTRVAQLIRSADVQAIRSHVCWYRWPSMTGKSFGRLGVPLGAGEEIRDSAEWLGKLLNGNVTYLDMPMLYNGGYVAMSALRAMKSATGSFYRSCIPDVYSAVAIASVTERYLYVHEPLAINGASRHSTGSSQFAVNDPTKPSPIATFQSEGNIPFHEDVPLCEDGTLPTSIQALVYESYLQSAMLRPPTQKMSHAQQLAAILTTSGRHHAAVLRWARLFAARHGLDLAAIEAKVTLPRLLFQIRARLGDTAAMLTNYGVGSEQLPIRDVYDASLAAKAIRDAAPGRISSGYRLLRHAAGKAIGITSG
jgi:hypothetical protein